MNNIKPLHGHALFELFEFIRPYTIEFGQTFRFTKTTFNELIIWN